LINETSKVVDEENVSTLFDQLDSTAQIRWRWIAGQPPIRAPRARIDGHTRIEVGFVATLTDTHPRGD